MKIIKFFLALCFLFTLAGVGVYWAAMRGSSLALEEIRNKTPLLQWWQLAESKTKPTISSVSSQAAILKDRTQTLGGYSSQVLGAAIEENKNSDSSIGQRAFEYGRYLYCQEVVKAYESSDPASTRPLINASPVPNKSATN